MFGTHRAVYNKLVECSSEDCYKLSVKDLNAKYRPISQKHSLANYLPDHHLDVPEEVMNSTYRDFLKSLKSSRALFMSLKDKGDKTTFPRLSFKSRKDNTTSIEIQSRTFKSTDVSVLKFFQQYFGFKKNEGILIKEAIPGLNYSPRLQRTREGEYYLCAPRVKEFDQTDSIRTCAIDPGVRSFITIYDPHGLTLSVDDTRNHIFNKCLLIDRLQSKLSRENKKRIRHRLRRMIYRGYQRVKAMISDMHQKISKWLSENYNEVLLPKFETSQMTSKQKRISSSTTRAMLTWSHYKFKMLLNYKMGRTGGRVIECQEHYTTKTCSCCGRINHNIKAQKVFTCPHCKLTTDRDVNAARNIFLKNEHLLTWSNRVQVSEIPTPGVV
jgi:IS605 OrfB family transposase